VAADFSIISYSFRHSFESGAMDIYSYIRFCAENGFTQLDPWMKHLARGIEDRVWLSEVRAAGQDSGLPFGCVAVDGGHIYEAGEAERAKTRQVREAWLETAALLGARMIRVDAGGPDDMPDEALDIIVRGYRDFIPRASSAGLTVVVENHWGPTKYPDNVVRLLGAVDGLGLLFDTGNWADGEAERGWELCARFAKLTHIKTLAFDSKGNESTMNVPKAIAILRREQYAGTWGIESTPENGDEIGSARKSLALIKREIG